MITIKSAILGHGDSSHIHPVPSQQTGFSDNESPQVQRSFWTMLIMTTAQIQPGYKIGPPPKTLFEWSSQSSRPPLKQGHSLWTLPGMYIKPASLLNVVRMLMDFGLWAPLCTGFCLWFWIVVLVCFQIEVDVSLLFVWSLFGLPLWQANLRWWELRIRRGGKKAKSRITTLDFTRAAWAFSGTYLEEFSIKLVWREEGSMRASWCSRITSSKINNGPFQWASSQEKLVGGLHGSTRTSPTKFNAKRRIQDTEQGQETGRNLETLSKYTMVELGKTKICVELNMVGGMKGNERLL